MDMSDRGDKLEMTEDQLHNYLREFSDRRWHPKYYLDVDTFKRSSGIWLRDAKEAHQLCALTHLTGLCEYLRLGFIKDRDTEKTLFTSGTKMPQHVASKEVEKCLEEIRAKGKDAFPTRTRTPLPVSVHATEQIPKPDEAYRAAALRLQTLLRQPTPKEFTARKEQGEELQNIKKQLRNEFQKAFTFSNDHLKRTERFYWRKLRRVEWLFDHEDFFQHGENLVIVSQPYGLDTSHLSQWCQTVGASFIIAKEWGYYYPGDATLFFVEFTPQAKADLDKRLRKSFLN